VRAAVKLMATLNRDAAAAGREAGVRACTDVTGFGLLGHLHEMARASGLAARVDAASVPIIPGARELAAAGAVPGGTEANRDHLSDAVEWEKGVSPTDRTLLCDAQTSGGLLFAAAPEIADKLVDALARRGIETAIIGEMQEGPSGRIVVA